MGIGFGIGYGIAGAAVPSAGGNLQLHLVADTDVYEDTATPPVDPCEDADFVRRWLDQSPNGLTVNDDAFDLTNRPGWDEVNAGFNNQSVIDYFSAWYEIHEVDLTGVSSSTSHTFYFVFRADVYSGAGDEPLLWSSALRIYPLLPTAQKAGIYDGAERASTFAPSSGTAEQWTFVLDGAGGTCDVYQNGSLVSGGSLSYTAQQLTGTVRLMGPDAASDGLDGQLAEVRWYDTNHNASERSAIESTLATKYGT